MIERALAEGHEVELHCMRHRRHTLQTRAEVEADTDEGLAVLREAGARPRRLRAPYGVAEWWTGEVLAERGLRLTGVSCDPRDWSEAGVASALEAARPDMKPGNVVVMHDGPEDSGSRADTVALIGPLLDEARSRGLQPAPLADGPAFWWHATTPRPDPEVSCEVVEDGELSGANREQAFALLAENISRSKADYAERGYRLVRPTFRVLARRRGRVVGHTSAMPLRSEPDLGLVGLGDTVVDPQARQRGVAAAMCDVSFAESRARGARVVLTDTGPLTVWCRNHGFRRPAPGELSASREGSWWLYRPEGTAPFRVIDDDF